MSETKLEDRLGEAAEKLIVAAALVFGSFLIVAWHGSRRINFKNLKLWAYTFGVYLFLGLAVFWDYRHLWLANKISPNMVSPNVLRFFVNHFSKWTHFGVLAIGTTLAVLFLIGLKSYFAEKKYQRGLDAVGLKTATGEGPKLLKAIRIDDNRIKLLVKSFGIGIDRYELKKTDLEAALNATIYDLACTAKKSIIQISLSLRELPTMVKFKDHIENLNEPCSFMVGDSLSGFINQPLTSLPHLMVAGTTGRGKSYFMSQLYLGLLKTTPHVQLYLLDLKFGVDVKDFKSIPNVRIAKTESEAVEMLEYVHKEMMLRFQLLEGSDFKRIDPKRDKRDIVIVGVDEASVLYGKEKTDKEKMKIVQRARALTDDLAKLGRSAAIHVILSTQKVTTETIDTKIQGNIGGRVCFRVATGPSSLNVLGNNSAMEIRDIPGRAIWNKGNSFVEVQTPLITDDEIKREAAELKNRSPLTVTFQEMYEIGKNKSKELVESTDDANENKK